MNELEPLKYGTQTDSILELHHAVLNELISQTNYLKWQSTLLLIVVGVTFGLVISARFH